MFIKLTNRLTNKAMVLAKSTIASVYQTEMKAASKETNLSEKVHMVVTIPTKELTTALFCGNLGTYYVTESVEEVYLLLKEA